MLSFKLTQNILLHYKTIQYNAIQFNTIQYNAITKTSTVTVIYVYLKGKDKLW